MDFPHFSRSLEIPASGLSLSSEKWFRSETKKQEETSKDFFRSYYSLLLLPPLLFTFSLRGTNLLFGSQWRRKGVKISFWSCYFSWFQLFSERLLGSGSKIRNIPSRSLTWAGVNVFTCVLGSEIDVEFTFPFCKINSFLFVPKLLWAIQGENNNPFLFRGLK